MYLIYEIAGNRLIKKQKVHFAGCINGVIPRRLIDLLPDGTSAPIKWHLMLQSILKKENLAFLIDIKPDGPDHMIGWVTDVFGDSLDPENPWTPMLIRLNMLIDVPGNDPSYKSVNKKEIILKDEEDVVYTIGHLKGSLLNGELVGTWNPGRGSLNSALLWPETLKYFIDCINILDKDLISSSRHTGFQLSLE